jgi:hypothetical protein
MSAKCHKQSSFPSAVPFSPSFYLAHFAKFLGLRQPAGQRLWTARRPGEEYLPNPYIVA